MKFQGQDGVFTLSFSLDLQPILTQQIKKLCGIVSLVLQSHTMV